MDNTLTTKVCNTCGLELPLSEFAQRRYRSNKPDAHYIYSKYGRCRDCTSKNKAAWRALHPTYMHDMYLKYKQLKSKDNAN
jgi:hypothetical protein